MDQELIKQMTDNARKAGFLLGMLEVLLMSAEKENGFVYRINAEVFEKVQKEVHKLTHPGGTTEP